ncbi:Flagellar cap protein FliD [human gut metagenome]|uniref:Filament cap protein n=1 Tax=human gut metagenome TaxID=408170 RepID=W1WMY4_9ZZZZ
MASINRLTGLATGLDTDSLIKNQMAAYESKVNAVIQKKDVAEIRQKLYRDILSDTRNFYNKYLDPLSKDSLLLSSAYKSVKFTSSDDSIVSVTSNSDAKLDNYKITGNVATAKRFELTTNIESGNTIIINEKEFTLKGKDEAEIAKNLNEELEKSGIKATVKYTKFNANGSNKTVLSIESTVLGSKSELTVGGDIRLGETIEGTPAKPATVTGITIDDIIRNKNITINGNSLDITETDPDEIIVKINTELEDKSIEFTAKNENGNIIFTAKNTGSTITDPKIEVEGAKIAFKPGTEEIKSQLKISKDDIVGNTIIVGGEKIEIKSTTTKDELDKFLAATKMELSEENGVLTFKYSATADNSNIPKIYKKGEATMAEITDSGKDANITIENSSGAKYIHTGDSNTVTLDGVTFKFNGTLPTDEDKAIKITGKVDVTETKDKIVNFINDYNTLMEKLNTTVNTKHDRDYVPLTSEQKEAMSDKEVELWEAKVETGQLYKDSDITRIMNSMKQTMRSVMSGSGFNLKEMGIIPIEDYSGNKNGTFTIDEDKLTEALENNMDDVLNLFTSNPKITTDTNGTTNKGILYQLKDTLYSEVMKSDSILSKKVGIEGTSTFTNNTLTKNISDYEAKIKKMQKDLATREQSLYSKYATLETIMNQYNSQQSYLTSYLGN